MSNVCHSTLTVYAPTYLTELARSVIEAALGPCLNAESMKAYARETDPKPLAVVRPASSGAFSMEVIAELSQLLPELSFEIADWDGAKGPGVGVTWLAGKVTGGSQEAAVAGGQPSDSQDAPSSSGAPTIPVTLRAIAERHWERGYHYIHDQIAFGEWIGHKAELEMHEHFEKYETVKSLLGPGDRERCELNERFYKERANRLAARSRARDRITEALEHCASPEVSCLLGAEDHETLERLAAVRAKVAPDFEAELDSVTV